MSEYFYPALFLLLCFGIIAIQEANYKMNIPDEVRYNR